MKHNYFKNLIKLSVIGAVAVVGLFVFLQTAEAARKKAEKRNAEKQKSRVAAGYLRDLSIALRTRLITCFQYSYMKQNVKGEAMDNLEAVEVRGFAPHRFRLTSQIRRCATTIAKVFEYMINENKNIYNEVKPIFTKWDFVRLGEI